MKLAPWLAVATTLFACGSSPTPAPAPASAAESAPSSQAADADADAPAPLPEFLAPIENLQEITDLTRWNGPPTFALVLDGDRVYVGAAVGAHDGMLFAVPRAGGELEPIATEPIIEAVAAGDALYGLSGRLLLELHVVRIPKEGGPVEPLTRKTVTRGALFAGGDSLWFTVTNEAGETHLERLALEGGAPASVPGTRGVGEAVVAGHDLLYSILHQEGLRVTGGHCERVPLDGGKAAVWDEDCPATQIVVAGDFVYSLNAVTFDWRRQPLGAGSATTFARDAWIDSASASPSGRTVCWAMSKTHDDLAERVRLAKLGSDIVVQRLDQAPLVVARGQFPLAVACDDDEVFWTHTGSWNGRVTIVSKAPIPELP